MNDFILRLHKRNLLLLVVLLVASILRLWNLSSVPPSASLDEASIAYNAYSVIRTGGDEFGKFPLISQRGYDDGRRSTFLLMSIPFVAVFNLSVLSVRLPSVIMSILTVWSLYHIVLLLFEKRTKFSYLFAYIAMILLAISPWHIYISRLGHESNACLSFLVFGILFFLLGLRRHTLLILAVIFLTLSMISYYSGQVFVPLLVIGLFAIYNKKLLKILFSSKKSVIGCLIVGIVLIPIVWSIFSPEALIRFRGTSTFSPEVHSELFAKRVELRNKAVENNDLIGTVIYNRHLFPVQVLLEGYFAHFKPEWLFTNPSNDSFKAPNTGLLYLWQIPFILMGLLGIILSKKLPPRSKLLIGLWLLLGSLPASIATQTPHAMRSYNIAPAWQIICAFGIIYFFYAARPFRRVIVVATIVIAFMGVTSFMNNYFYVFPKEQSKSFQYALARAIPYVLQNQHTYNEVIFSNEDNLYQSYMLFLYHSKYDPVVYQQQGGTISGGYAETHRFGKYSFRPIDWEKDNRSGVLIVGNPKDIPKEQKAQFVGKYLNNQPGVIVISGSSNNKKL